MDEPSIQSGIGSAIDLLSDMIIHYLAVQEKRKARRDEVMVWLGPILDAEDEAAANEWLTAKLLGTSGYRIVA
ncbi:hypothetical protein [Paenibacillus sp.]|uniref:hypothetical protein n=1 Tax=Paenibacillus sp. TaxID=58172 RepID=UPI003568BA48